MKELFGYSDLRKVGKDLAGFAKVKRTFVRKGNVIRKANLPGLEFSHFL